MDTNGEICLGLGLGLAESYPEKEILQKKNKGVFFLDLSIATHSNDHGGLDLNSSSRQDEKRSKEDDDGDFSMNFSRKKLRLSRDQTALLEDSFKQHTTLNPTQKQALAEKLNLKPRQVEVWFQNRRARTKLKQTEVECEFLKKNCGRLSDENRRLKKELLELRSSLKIDKPQPPRAATPFFHQNGGGRYSGEKQEETAAAAVLGVVHEP